MNQQYAKANKQICVYTDVQVIDGEVNLKIQNTYAWMAHVDNIQNLEEFYIKVKDPGFRKVYKKIILEMTFMRRTYLNVKNEIANKSYTHSQQQCMCGSNPSVCVCVCAHT
ncbi:hypothetical protein [Chryseobacterium indoltheticum]|uniref:hypothetical protein n=1 Tax=Chryseobacterium indoltheticum TaxID=254 RepID=UPI003F497E5F